MTPKKAKTATATLAQLTDAYVKHLEDAGKSRGTAFSYESELKLAQRELGAEKSIGDITRDDITFFNNCPRVTTLRSGGAKSQLSIDKSRRVLRLALAWAVAQKLIETSPAEPIATEPAPTKAKRAAKKGDEPLPRTPGVTVVVGDKQITDGAPVEKKAKRKRRGAVVLEVGQAEAERAADAAEAMAADTTEPAA